MAVQTWRSPRQHYEYLQAQFALQSGAPSVPWRYGKHAVAQDTGIARIVYQPTGDVELSMTNRYKGFDRCSGAANSPNTPNTIHWDGIEIKVYCFGTEEELFSNPEEGFWGLRDRVGTLIRYSVAGPKDERFTGTEYPQTDFSAQETDLTSWVFTFPLWLPLLDVSGVGSSIVPAEIASVDLGYVGDI